MGAGKILRPDVVETSHVIRDDVLIVAIGHDQDLPKAMRHIGIGAARWMGLAARYFEQCSRPLARGQRGMIRVLSLLGGFIVAGCMVIFAANVHSIQSELCHEFTAEEEIGADVVYSFFAAIWLFRRRGRGFPGAREGAVPRPIRPDRAIMRA
jgi:hypothetical protein